MKTTIALIIAAILMVLVIASLPTVKPLNCGLTAVSNFFDNQPA